MGILIFCQMFGGSTFLTLAETIFSNSLRTVVPEDAPGANVDAIVAAGATAFRNVVSSEELPGVLRAYTTSIDHVFYLVCGAGVAGFAFSWGIGWRDIRKKEDLAQSPES